MITYEPWSWLISEYGAANGPVRTLKAALSEALFLLGLERNADVVVASSFAPLLRNANGNASRPCCGNQHNLLNFNATHLFATPSFYAQRMLRDSLGTHALATAVGSGITAAKAGGGLWGAQASTSNLSSPLMSVVLKLVNYAAVDQPVNITLSGLGDQKIAAVSADILTDIDPLAENTLDDPRRVQPRPMPMNRWQQINEQKTLWSPSRGSPELGDLPFPYGWVQIGSDSRKLEVHLPPWSLVIATVKLE